MDFRWNQRFPPEYEEPASPPVWVYVTIFVVLLVLFAGGTILSWPEGKPVDSNDFLRTALAAPFALGVTFSALIYIQAYDATAFEAAVKNGTRHDLLNAWYRNGRVGMAVLDSVILTPEPDLAERMLKLEGSPPDNPGKVMRLDSVVAGNEKSRRCAMLEKLLTPLVPKLAGAMRSESFDIVLQCDDEEPANDIRTVWQQLGVPGVPRIRRIGNDTNPGFAAVWFEDETYGPYVYHTSRVYPAPKYRLVLAWHLNDDTAEASPTASEAAVALLLGSWKLMSEKPDMKRQAWLLRQIEGEADQVDTSLGLLLRTKQVEPERVHHFWYSRLKGLAQHSTLGAVRDADIKVEEHALDPAVGPQAPVARWLLAALAAKMAHFGQGAQLIALPDPKGVILNLVVREPDTVTLPWPDWYSQMNDTIPIWHIGCCMALLMSVFLLSPNSEWGTFETVMSCVIGFAIIAGIGGRILIRRVYRDQVWDEYG